MLPQSRTGKLTEGNFRAVRGTVHQHLRADGDQEIFGAALPELQSSLFFRINTVNDLPGKSHKINLLDLGIKPHHPQPFRP
jgi:hypothetical protein